MLWRAFPVNIQTTLIYDTFITFLCHIFYFLSVKFLFCFFIFHFTSIFFISIPINLYIYVLSSSLLYFILFILYAFYNYSLYLFHFFSFRVTFFIFFLISMQHVITQRRPSFTFRHFDFRSHGRRTVCLSCGRGCLRDFK